MTTSIGGSPEAMPSLYSTIKFPFDELFLITNQNYHYSLLSLICAHVMAEFLLSLLIAYMSASRATSRRPNTAADATTANSSSSSSGLCRTRSADDSNSARSNATYLVTAVAVYFARWRQLAPGNRQVDQRAHFEVVTVV